MNKFIVAAAVTVMLAGVPVAAATYVAFTSFNGVNGAGNFNYGYTDGTALTSFDGSATGATCALPGGTCLYSAAQGALPQASVGGFYPTVTVPTDAILLHPGQSDSLAVYSGFVATNAGSYTYTIDLKSVGTDTGTGVGYTTFTSLGGIVILGTRSVLPTYLSSASLTGTQTLTLGEVFGVIIDRNGDYGGDSTGLNFTISDVPEPAAWALMLGGFAMIGAAARRRRSVVAA